LALWFDKLTTNGKTPFILSLPNGSLGTESTVRPELVEGCGGTWLGYQRLKSIVERMIEHGR
jgi:hypothetical protein